MSFDFCDHCNRLIESTLCLTPVWLEDECGTWKEWLCWDCLSAVRDDGMPWESLVA